MKRTLIATHPTEGAIYQDETGQYYHVAPDGIETKIELEETTDIAFSEIGGAIFQHVDTPDNLKLIAKHPTEGAIYEDREGNMFYHDGRGLLSLTADEYDSITFSDPDNWQEYDDDDDENGAFTNVFFEPR